MTSTSVSPTTYLGSGTTIAEIISGLQPNTAYRWRARVLETANGVTTLGPWLRVLNHDVQGCDVRTNTESDLALSITGPAAVAEQHDFDVVFTIDNNVVPANGPDIAQDVELVISNIPSTYLYKGMRSNNAGAVCSSPTAVGAFRTDTCTITSINPGTATSITMTYQANAKAKVLVNGSLIGTVSLKNTDPDLTNNTATYNITMTPKVGVTVNDTTPFVTNEDKLMAPRSVVLNGPPDGTVTISISTSKIVEGTASPSSIEFTAKDWNIPKPISIHGVPAVDRMASNKGSIGYDLTLKPGSNVQLDNDQIKGTKITADIIVKGINDSTDFDGQQLVLAIPRAQTPGYDAKNIPAGNVSLRWNKVTSPSEMPVNYTVTLCKNDVTLTTCLAPIVVADNSFSPILYASFGGSSLLFLGLMNTRIRRRWVIVLITLAAASTLVSCSGSGGSTLPPSAPPAADTMGTTVMLDAGVWYWKVVAADGISTPVSSQVMIFAVQ